MKNDLSELKGYMANIHNDIYCAYKSTLNSATWYANNQCSNYSRFYFVLDGTCWISIDGVEYIAEKNNLILIPANYEYSYKILGNGKMTKLWCHFNSTINDTSLFEVISCSYVIRITDVLHITKLFTQLVQLTQNSFTITDHLKQQMLLSEILINFLTLGNYKSLGHFNENRMRLNRTITYMRTHLYEEITVFNLAELVHMSPNYFIQLFTRTYGISPLKMLSNFRIKVIKELLEETETPISEIATMVGFQDKTYFSKYVKKLIGMSPREYRNSKKSIAPK